MIKQYIYNLQDFSGTRAEYLETIRKAEEFANSIPKSCAEKDSLLMAIQYAKLESQVW